MTTVKINAIQDGRMVETEVDADRYAAFDSLSSIPHLKASIKSPLSVGDDNAAMAFLVSQLAFTENRIFESKYQPLQYEQFLPLDFSAGEWAATIDYEIVDRVGQGGPTNWKSKAINMVDIGYARKSIPVVPGNIGYNYTQEELRRTAYLRRALPEGKLNAAMEGYQRHLNQVGLVGEPATGLTGLFNNPTVPQGNAPKGNWSAATPPTPDEIIADLNFALLRVWEGTQYNVIPDTVLIAPAAFAKIASTPRAPQSDTTILAYFKANNILKQSTGQEVNVMPGWQLNDAGVVAAGAPTRRVVAYRKDPELLTMHIPLPLRFLAPQLTGLAVEVPGEYKYSGVTVRYPKSVFYMDGV